MTQGELFGKDLPPYQRHSETSKAAAISIEPSVESLKGKVLAFIRSRGTDGATDEEMQDALDLNPSTQRLRRVELWQAGLIKELVEIKRTTKSGRWACVWVAAEYA